MFGAPALADTDYAGLVSLAGGFATLRRALRYVPAEELRRPSPAILALIWHAGPLGRAAAAIDLENELRAVQGENVALRAAVGRLQRQLTTALEALHSDAANGPIWGPEKLSAGRDRSAAAGDRRRTR